MAKNSVFVYDVRKKVVVVNGKDMVIDNEQVHALFTLGEGLARDTQKAFTLYREIPEDVRKNYRKAAEVVFSRMTVNVWERACSDSNVALFLEKSPAIAQAYASLDDNNPQKPAFVALAKQALETKGGASKFVADVKKENARYRGNTRSVEDILKDIEKAKKVLADLQAELAKAKAA